MNPNKFESNQEPNDNQLSASELEEVAGGGFFSDLVDAGKEFIEDIADESKDFISDVKNAWKKRH